MKKKLKNSLMAMGLSVLLAGGVMVYLGGQIQELSWNEMIAIYGENGIFNKKLREIRTDCKNDIRCKIIKDKDNKDKKVIIFKASGVDKIFGIRVDKLLVKNMNQWLKNESEKPNFYKLKK